MTTSNKPPKSPRARIGQLGLASITAITGVVVVLAAAGFFAGRISAPKADRVAQPATTVTVTAPSTAVPASADLPTGTVALTPSPSPSASSSGTESPGPGSTSSNGTELGSYNVKIPPGFGVPLGPAAPTQSQFVSGGGVGDLYYSGNEFDPEGADKMLMLPNGSTPTYRACTADTVFTGSASNTPGTAFCLIETGTMASVTVKSVSPTQSYILVHVNVWKNVS